VAAVVTGKRGYWIKIGWKDRKGYAFTAYLEAASADNPRNCSALLPALTSYNRRSGIGVLPFREGMVGDLTGGEYKLAAGRLDHLRAVIPAGRVLPLRIRPVRWPRRRRSPGSRRGKSLTQFRLELATAAPQGKSKGSRRPAPGQVPQAD
jgi:hypothetical protein